MVWVLSGSLGSRLGDCSYLAGTGGPVFIDFWASGVSFGGSLW